MPAESKAQQRLFGMAYAAKKNKTPNKELSPEVARLKKMLSKKQLKDFAATKTEDLPEHKDSEDKKTTKRASISEKMKKMAASIKTLPFESTSEFKNPNALNLKQFKGNANTAVKSTPKSVESQLAIKRASISEKMTKFAGPAAAATRFLPRLFGFLGKGTKAVGRGAKAVGSGVKRGVKAGYNKSWGPGKSIGSDVWGATKAGIAAPYLLGRAGLKTLIRHPYLSAVGGFEGYRMLNSGDTASTPKSSGIVDSVSKWYDNPENKKLLQNIAAVGGSGLAGYLLSSALTSGMDEGFMKSALRGLGALGAAGAGAALAGDWSSKDD